jgi:hypothetical protein
VLRFQAARLRAQLENAETPVSSINIFDSASFEAALVRVEKSRSARKPVAHLLQVHARARAEQSLHKLLGAHFQAEDGDRLSRVNRHMLRDIHREGRLTHAGARRDDESFPPDAARSSSDRAT